MKVETINNSVFEMLQLEVYKIQENVEIVLSKDRRTVWVNVDGICVTRLLNIPELTITDFTSDKTESTERMDKWMN